MGLLQKQSFTRGEALIELKKVISARKVNFKEKHIVFVPDHSTLRVEQILFMDGGAFDVEVLTFNRFFSKIYKTAPVSFLSREGGIMLIKKIVDECLGELKCFTRSAGKIGFCEKLYETLNQLLASDVSTESFSAKSKKLSDISLILKKYLAETENVFLDSSGKMRLLIGSNKVKDYLKNTHIYFANFDSFTPLNQKAVEFFSQCSLSSKIFDAGLPKSFPPITIYEADGSATELKAVAKRIRDYVFSGGRYGDVGVVALNASYLQVKRIFSENKIPFYLDNARLLSEHPFSLFLGNVFKVGQRLKRASVVALSKSPFIKCEFSDKCEFENYVNTFCVDYLGFLNPFDKRKNQQSAEKEILREEAAERVREKIAYILKTFSKPLNESKSSNEFCELAFKLIEEFYVEEKDESAEEIFLSFGIGSSASLGAINKIKENLQLLKRVMPGERKASELIEVLYAGLNSTTLSPLPLKTETVVIGEPSAFRGAKLKKLFIVGALEGRLPRAGIDTGLISDREIVALREESIIIDPTVGEVNERNLNEFLSLISDSEDCFISYSSSEGRLTSAAIALVKNAKKWTETSSLYESQSLLSESDEIRISRHCSSRAAALELIVAGNNSGLLPGFSGEVLAALHLDERVLTGDENRKRSIENSDIFFKNSSSTISRIQEFYVCPYRHFLTYGLKLKEKKDGTLSPLDIGSILHKIIELFVPLKQTLVDYGSREKLIDKILDQDEKCRLQANKAVSLRIKKEALKICDIVAKQMERGTMKNLGVEMRFGNEKNCEFPALKLGGEGAEIFLRGTIDRVDVTGNTGVVIDYKTGKDRFNFKDLYFGKKLQLPLYLAAINSGGFLEGGMFYFPFRTAWDDNEKSHRFSGLFLKDKDFYCAMDSSLSECGVSSTVIQASTNKKPDKNGEAVLFGNNKWAVTQKEFKMITAYALGMGQEAVRCMKNGVIDRLVLSSDNDCGYCPYRAVCGDKGMVYRGDAYYDSEPVRKFLLMKNEEVDNAY